MLNREVVEQFLCPEYHSLPAVLAFVIPCIRLAALRTLSASDTEAGVIKRLPPPLYSFYYPVNRDRLMYLHLGSPLLELAVLGAYSPAPSPSYARIAAELRRRNHFRVNAIACCTAVRSGVGSAITRHGRGQSWQC